MELTTVSAIRGATPHVVAEAVESYLDGAGLVRAPGTPGPATAGIRLSGAREGWTTVTWPSYFAPQDLPACRWLSRELRTVVSTVTTTDAEGWSHTLFGCGTELDRFHSFPGSLAWDDEDVAALSRDWAGDFELVARVFGVDACGIRRHFCHATSTTRAHPGRERDGYLELWSALGIRPSDDRPYAVLAVDPAWSRITAR